MTPPVEILLGDEFAEKTGTYPNYDALPANQEAQIELQKHTDLRSMVQSDITAKINMLYLDLLSIADLDLKTMQDLEGNYVVQRGEQWSQGAFGAQTDRNNWPGMVLSCLAAGNPNLTQSILVT